MDLAATIWKSEMGKLTLKSIFCPKNLYLLDTEHDPPDKSLQYDSQSVKWS